MVGLLFVAAGVAGSMSDQLLPACGPWICVTDRVPDTNRPVLVWCQHFESFGKGDARVSSYNYFGARGGCFDIERPPFAPKVRYWAELHRPIR